MNSGVVSALASLPFAAGVGCALLGLHLLAGVAHRHVWPNRLLGTFFLLFANQLLLQSHQLGSPEPHLGPYRVMLILAANPFVYLFFRSLRTRASFSIRLQDGAHFFPVVLVPTLVHVGYPGGVDLLLFGSMVAYGVVHGLALRHGIGQFPEASRMAYRWLQGFTVFYATAALLDAAIALELLGDGDLRTSRLLAIAVVLIFTLIMLLLFSAMGRRSIYDRLVELTASASRLSMSDDALDELAGRIRRTIADERVHGDEAMSLSRFARRMGAPPRHVSQAINRRLGVSFSELLNAARVDAASRLLTDASWQDRSVTDVAYEVGFRSKSNFHRAFKDIMGMTPGEFRASHGTLSPPAESPLR